MKVLGLIIRLLVTAVLTAALFWLLAYVEYYNGDLESLSSKAVAGWFSHAALSVRLAVLLSVLVTGYIIFHGLGFVPVHDYRDETVRCFRLKNGDTLFHYVKGNVNLEGRKFTFTPFDKTIPAVSIPFDKIVDCSVDLDTVRMAFSAFASLNERANFDITYMDDAGNIDALSFRLAHDSVLIAALRNMVQNRYTISTE